MNKNQLFRSMLEQAEKNEVKFEYVVVDNWFSSNKNMRFIHYDMNEKFIMGINSNRLIDCEEGDKKGQHQNLSCLNLKDREKR